MLQEDVGNTIQEDHARLGKLAGGSPSLPLGHNGGWWLHVPCPTQIGPAAYPSSKGQKTVPEEDASFDKVRETVENLNASLQNKLLALDSLKQVKNEANAKKAYHDTTVSHSAGSDSRKT